MSAKNTFHIAAKSLRFTSMINFNTTAAPKQKSKQMKKQISFSYSLLNTHFPLVRPEKSN